MPRYVEMQGPRACRPAAASAPSSVEHAPIPPGLRRLSAHPWHRSLVNSRCDTQPIRPLPSGYVKIAIEYGHRNSGLTMIYLLKMVIFHSFVSLPEGTQYDPVICCGCDLWIGGLIISILGIGLDFFFSGGHDRERDYSNHD